MPPQAHLLSIPLEIRRVIYAHVVQNIQEERFILFGNPRSAYDGLRRACKQIHKETLESVFFSSFTQYQTSRLLEIRPNKTNFQIVRSISIELPFSLGRNHYAELCLFLERMQLSIQELHIFFFGHDQCGNETKMFGCGNKKFLRTNRTPMLLDEGQDFSYQWHIIRMLSVLRNLRVVQVENANIPLSQGILYSNKPFLKAVSVTCDPRSTPSSLSRMNMHRRAHLYRNITVTPTRFPPVEVLNLDVNSASNAEGMVNGVDQTLRQLSWRVPNTHLQPYMNERCYYSTTNRVLQMMATRAPKLESLRLCLSMRSYPAGGWEANHDMATATAEFSHRLSSFKALKHLEIHYEGDTGFFRRDMIRKLPNNVERLYISDRAISASQLVTQVRDRYFKYTYDNGLGLGPPNSGLDDSWNIGWAHNGPHNSPRQGRYLKAYQTDDEEIVGEKQVRQDDMPLSSGNLGFVNYEYDYVVGAEICDGSKQSCACQQCVRGSIFKLNGMLLDREHNLHLVDSQAKDGPYGIRPVQQEVKTTLRKEELRESASYSRHKSIYAAIYDTMYSACRHVDVKQNQIDLDNYLSDKYKWYFGNEAEAMKVFEREPVAKFEDQIVRPMVGEVEVSDSVRCEWASPDIEVAPVGAFPTPCLPVDWKECVEG